MSDGERAATVARGERDQAGVDVRRLPLWVWRRICREAFGCVDQPRVDRETCEWWIERKGQGGG